MQYVPARTNTPDLEQITNVRCDTVNSFYIYRRLQRWLAYWTTTYEFKTYGYEMHDIKRFVSGVNKNLWKEGINFPTRVFRPYAIQYYTFLALLGHVGLSQVITNLYRLRYV